MTSFSFFKTNLAVSFLFLFVVPSFHSHLFRLVNNDVILICFKPIWPFLFFFFLWFLSRTHHPAHHICGSFARFYRVFFSFFFIRNRRRDRVSVMISIDWCVDFHFFIRVPWGRDRVSVGGTFRRPSGWLNPFLFLFLFLLLFSGTDRCR